MLGNSYFNEMTELSGCLSNQKWDASLILLDLREKTYMHLGRVLYFRYG